MQLIEANIYLLEGYGRNKMVLVAKIGEQTFTEQKEYEEPANLAEETYILLKRMISDHSIVLLPLLHDYFVNRKIPVALE